MTQPLADPLVFRWPVRVYFEDTDAAGLVYRADDLKLFERCRTECLRCCGIEQRGLAARDGVAFVVVDLGLSYRQPARLDDAIDAAIDEQARSWLVLRQQAWRGDERLAASGIEAACVDAARLTPLRLPPQLAQRLVAAACSC